MEKVMIKVKFRKSHPRFAYFAGDLAEIDTDSAAKLLKSGHVIVLPDDEDDDNESENTLPEDIPSRKKLLGLGCATVEQVKALYDSGKLKDEGLNASELGKLKKYFSEPAPEKTK